MTGGTPNDTISPLYNPNMTQAPLPGQTPNINILKDVQGDVVLGFPKKKQELIFFVIKKPGDFKEALPRLNISSTEDVVAANAQIAQIKREAPGSLAPVGFLNIAFSKKGLDVLGVKGNLGDQPFVDGQLKGAELLGDSNTPGSEKFDPDWDLAYKQTIHGVLNVAGESWRSVNEKVTHAKNVLGSSIQVVHSLKGSVRPGDDKGREHFGWEDSISNPAVRGVGVDGQGTILPGQRPIDAGIILRGLQGDLIPAPPGGLPAWGVGGSFLVFRQIEQHVPEFHQFLKLKAASLGDPSEHAVEVLGAQLVGRWKSGAPIQRTPDLQDIPSKGKDKQWNNDFVYPQDRGDAGQNLCPYAAHIRKTNPRNDLDQFGVSAVDRTSVIRAGIPYGPELSFDEKAEEVTELERGLVFVCYQSSVKFGFQFMQESWANAPDFPPEKDVTAGFDPIIGQRKGPNRDRETFGTAADGFKITGMPDFIKSRGGEYFFAPTIPVLKSAFN